MYRCYDDHSILCRLSHIASILFVRTFFVVFILAISRSFPFPITFDVAEVSEKRESVESKLAKGGFRLSSRLQTPTITSQSLGVLSDNDAQKICAANEDYV